MHRVLSRHDDRATSKQQACPRGPSLQLEHDVVWTFLLKDGWQPLDQSVVCKLLCCSRGMAELVHRAVAGRLAVQLRDGNVAARLGSKKHSRLSSDGSAVWLFAKWLARHPHLVSQLTLAPAVSEGQVVLQRSLPAFRRARGLIKLLWGRMSLMSGPAMRELTAAAVSSLGQHLTKLEWSISSSCCSSPELHTLLRRLKKLRYLGLTCCDSGAGSASMDHLAPDLQQLQELTELKLQHFTISRSSTQQLPPSLLSLQLGPALPRLQAAAMRQQQLLLQHLTQLHTLQLHCLKACDQLPTSLTSLKLAHCSLLPLLPLTKLQQLHLTADTPEAVLVQLTSLPALQELQLTYQSWSLSEAGCCALHQLPLRSLSCTLPQQQLTHLGHWQTLTDLQLQLEIPLSDDLQVELAQQLQQLTALKSLGLMAAAQQQQQQQQQQQVTLQLPAAESPPLSAAAAATVVMQQDLVDAVHCLPHLQSLQLQGFQLYTDTAPQLQLAVEPDVVGQAHIGPAAGAAGAAAALLDGDKAAADVPQRFAVLITTE